MPSEPNALKVTIVTNLFHPDELGGAALMTDLAVFLKEKGVNVNVVGTFGYYPGWQLDPKDVGVWRRDEVYAGIPVRRLRMFVPRRASTRNRLLSDFSFFLSLTCLGRSAWREADVIFTACPMFGQIAAMRLATPFRRVPKMAIIQDFVVDAALELGMIRGPFVGRLLKAIERWAFRSCDTLTTISEEMQAKLRPLVGDDRRTLFIPNWIHQSLAQAIDVQRQRAVVRKPNQLFYSGNVGRKQGLPDFLNSFHGDGLGWQIKINGGGAEFEQLLEACQNRRDVVLEGLQEEALYIASLLSCTACLVTQKANVGANFLPSKLLPALASGTPVLAICEAHSPLGREIVEAKCGVVISPNDAEGLQATLKRWSEHPEELAKYSENALARGVLYRRDTVLNRFHAEICRLAPIR